MSAIQSLWSRRGVAVAAACAASSWVTHNAVAQVAPVPAAAPVVATAAPQTVVVTGNPLRSEGATLPASVLAGDALVLQRGGSLGETLQGLPGVAATGFGPNASRPVIRGQDGDRIRVLGNSGASLDASALSFDHAVPIDPLVIERVEVVRGPAALLYGGSAVGGVVNTIDNRIPRSPQEGISGALEARFGGASNERSLSALVEAGGNGLVLHADAFRRLTDDLRVPRFEREDDAGLPLTTDRVRNSGSDASGGALGGSWVWSQGHLGASIASYRSDYGIVVEDDVRIRMRNDKLSVSGEWRGLPGWVQTLRAQAAFTDYQHQEVEGSGVVGTTFSSRGGDARIEAVHRPLQLGGLRLQGVLGLQAESSRFEALGEEAFVPGTRTRQLALFALEQWDSSPQLGLSAGVRIEQVRVASDGDADPANARFGPAVSRSFTPMSASLGAHFVPAPAWRLTGNLAWTQRAPTSYELYADGVHAATSAYERGNAQQALERGVHLDTGLGWQKGGSHLQLGLFWSRFAHYIALMKSAEPDFIDDAGDALPVYAFEGVPARLYGLEVEAGRQWTVGPAQLALTARLDAVRGRNLHSGEPLPRLAPLRASLSLDARHGLWHASAELTSAARQSRVPQDDSATPGWTQLHLGVDRRLGWGPTDALLFAKLRNAGNALAYNASAVATVRALSPMPGRSLMLGVQFRL